mmetsp:Transcript_32148/g.44055  ORF Transcript_32148/g.44055 Transcript_32148/m.44055 type:complete len:194 (-) Transcript_32148:14-595(-)
MLYSLFLSFLFLFPCLESVQHIPSAERSALYNLYTETDGPNWLSNYNWLIGDPCLDAWFGISNCVTDQNDVLHVTSLAMPENRLLGNMTTGFLDLTYLTHLDLQRNSLSGTIPDMPDSLNYLDFQVCTLTGTVPNLSSLVLQTLFLNNNQLNGTLSSWVCNATQHDLTQNKFDCPLPECCSNSGGDGKCEPCV